MPIDQTNVSDAATSATPPVIGGSEILGMGVSMLFIVAAILLLGWIYSRSRLHSGGASDVISVVATRALGPKERLMVVEVADLQLLLGMTASGVQTLHVFESPVVVSGSVMQATGFAGRLRSAIREFTT